MSRSRTREKSINSEHIKHDSITGQNGGFARYRDDGEMETTIYSCTDLMGLLSYKLTVSFPAPESFMLPWDTQLEDVDMDA